MRSSAGAVCIAESVISYFVRYSSRLFACFTDSAWAKPRGVSAGRRIPWARASSSIVLGRRQPSKCTCNSALGQRRSASFERRGGPCPALTTTRKIAPPPPTGSAPPNRRPPPPVPQATPPPSSSPRALAPTPPASPPPPPPAPPPRPPL